MTDRYDQRRADRTWDNHQAAIQRTLTFRPTYRPLGNGRTNASSLLTSPSSYSLIKPTAKRAGLLKKTLDVAAAIGKVAVGGAVVLVTACVVSDLAAGPYENLPTAKTKSPK